MFVRWAVHSSFTYPLLTGVGLIHRLETTKFGCWIGDSYVGCNLYADDLIFISPSVCHLQKMINVCVEEAI